MGYSQPLLMLGLPLFLMPKRSFISAFDLFSLFFHSMRSSVLLRLFGLWQLWNFLIEAGCF